MLTSLGTAIAVQSMVSTYIVFPLPLNDISMTLIGMYIGSYFVLFPLRSLLHNMVTSAQVVLINIVLTALIAFGASHLTGFPSRCCCSPGARQHGSHDIRGNCDGDRCGFCHA